MRLSSALVLVAAAASILSGCSLGPTPGESSSGGPPPSTTPLVDRSDLVVPTTKTPGTTRITGRVAAGVEAGCTVLRTEDGQTYTLTGAAAPSPGSDDLVTLEGRVDPDLVSYCQQGPIFVVTAVLPG